MMCPNCKEQSAECPCNECGAHTCQSCTRPKKVRTRFGTFELGQKVTYSVFPHLKDGTGIVVEGGIESTGKTRKFWEKDGFCTVCEWSQACDVKPR